MSPFDFVKSINDTKKDLIREGTHKENDYNPFITNKNFSLYLDTVFDANYMNKDSGLSNMMQFDFYRLNIKRRKRYVEWPKNIINDNILLLSKHFNLSINKTKEIIRVIPKEIIENLILKLTQSIEGVKK